VDGDARSGGAPCLRHDQRRRADERRLDHTADAATGDATGASRQRRRLARRHDNDATDDAATLACGDVAHAVRPVAHGCANNTHHAATRNHRIEPPRADDGAPAWRPAPHPADDHDAAAPHDHHHPPARDDDHDRPAGVDDDEYVDNHHLDNDDDRPAADHDHQHDDDHDDRPLDDHDGSHHDDDVDTRPPVTQRALALQWVMAATCRRASRASTVAGGSTLRAT
jgi:hypothetical protein